MRRLTQARYPVTVRSKGGLESKECEVGGGASRSRGEKPERMQYLVFRRAELLQEVGYERGIDLEAPTEVDKELPG